MCKGVKWNINKRLNIINELLDYDIFDKKDVIKKINEIHEIDKKINDLQNDLLKNNNEKPNSNYIEIEININTILGYAIYVNKNISYSNSNKYNDLLNKLFAELHLPHNII
jgi:AAA+ ATPase superfamily predicted ATPase